jgi:hypothetical protein
LAAAEKQQRLGIFFGALAIDITRKGGLAKRLAARKIPAWETE